ncbi:hypothetical protein DSCO28_21420 [Desulfosarcina ovata subsp. sediminis]|uniref:Uncharacterized protein n=1 Tax=Desulfosarcina ovata subsp. sediminis TaxID=885957 RepID=A0A5K7ZKK9_9BACT|nr:hypothetical protein [Desulfosarcina ovata]BBO81576.1 hypothetical protein DSCO28_21420 [Desulfosarcina ovata subsp. sediminis]
MNPKKHNLLYSVNTWLSYNISIRYYGGAHYIWCSPVFSIKNHPASHATPPPTSCPSDIYHNLSEEVRRRDSHSAKIKENRSGLITGAQIQHGKGIITDVELDEIKEIIAAADYSDFRPLLYLIPFAGVSHLLKEVPVSDRAHPLSQEYIIEELPTELFDTIELEKG